MVYEITAPGRGAATRVTEIIQLVNSVIERECQDALAELDRVPTDKRSDMMGILIERYREEGRREILAEIAAKDCDADDPTDGSSHYYLAMPLALYLVALIFAVIELVRSKGSNLLAWGLGAIALGLTWGRWGF